MAVLVDRWRDAISLSLQKMEQKNWDERVTGYKEKGQGWGEGRGKGYRVPCLRIPECNYLFS